MEARLALKALDYPIPKAANRWTYMLGGLTAAFIVLLIATGLYLSQFYNPSPIGAYDSVLYIITRAPLGDWIRSLHYWSAGTVTVTITMHLVYVFWRLAGVAAETAVVMLIYLDESFHRRSLEGRMRSAADVADAVREGALERLRPVLMTVTAITAGLAPILWSTGTGADVMKRIASPMVGGMITATVLTLVVIPAIYLLWRSWQVAHRPRALLREAAG